ncbi:MAG: M1 family metallopeptidase [Anaerolineae bacterium]|nr:M1 family metallopeptidase [Anaerolineae bacterium]MCB9132397.1 M1 family metallopeptidase [Anaerolineales bacterium]MCB0249223.1 M1 family metallopeptidase [Anaerolineae bacterium]MCB9142264.1 M1 family metallopeptidase [Anaerolineales bacterium]MCO5245760.1 M1 family metallopeptidase [Anaerolineae bacterium]
MKKFIPLTILLLTLASLTSACAGVTLPWAAAPAADPLADFRIAMAPGQQDLLDDLPAMPVYRIETHIDPADLSLTGRMEVTLPAVEADALPEDLFFRLYPNLAHYAGSMSVDLVSVNDHGAPFSYEAANTAVHVVVPPDSVVAGKPIRVGMQWRLGVLPFDEERYTLLGSAGGVLSLPLFYPVLAVQDAGEQGQWHLDIGLVQGDAAYTQAALYDVTAIVPPNYAVAGSGSLMTVTDARGPTPEAADATAPVWKAWHMVSGPAREFALFVSDQYQQAETDAGDVRVVSWYRPGEETAGRAAAEYAAAALRIYSDLFGPYPYAELDVVAGPIEFRGMEYPGLFELGYKLYNANADELEFRIAHEAAHQWWYNLVGNDPVNEPWLDEGLAEYATYFYRERTKGQVSAERLAARRWQAAWEFTRDRGLDAVVDQPVEAFQGNYETIVYGKAALFHHLLQQAMGEDAYLTLLRRYVEQYRFREATPEDFMALAEEIGGPQVRELYDKWIEHDDEGRPAVAPQPTPTPAPE